jgi:hypothetical protein
MLQLVEVDKLSPFLGEECALCKDPLTPGDTAVICPQDGSRHHDRCWAANGNKCAAYGCRGQGELAPSTVATPVGASPLPAPALSSPPDLPLTHSESCSQSCLILAIAVAIIFFSIGCFGLWAIADYLMLHFWNLPYRAPFSGLIPLLLT